MVDIGPAAGEHGGEIIAAGPVEQVINDPNSLTAAYLRGDREIPLPAQRRIGNGKKLVVRGARANNLKDIDVAIPLGTFVAVLGGGGSGEASLVAGILSREGGADFFKGQGKTRPPPEGQGVPDLHKNHHNH